MYLYNTTMEADEVSFSVALGSYFITAQNNFSGGQIKVGINSSPITKSSPYIVSTNTNDVVYLESIDNQVNGGYTRIWNDGVAPSNKSNWTKRPKDGSFEHFDYNQATNFTVNSSDDAVVYQANLRKICNLTFTNSFNGTNYTGSIKVNAATVTAPTAQYQVVEGNTITVEALTYIENDIKYEFNNWSDNGSTSNPRTITVSQHANITANFIGSNIY